jgi:hypothetical protein
MGCKLNSFELISLRSAVRHREHQSLQTSLFEMMVAGECFGEMALLHDYYGQAIGETPILVTASPIQIDSSNVEFCIERNNLDTFVSANSTIALGGSGARNRIGERVEPLPKHGFGGHNPASGLHHSRVPGYRSGVVLISLAGERNPE